MKWVNLSFNILLVIGAFSAFVIYYVTKKNERKDAALMIITQIDEIRKDIITIKQSVDVNFISEQPMFESNKLLVDDIWKKYKHLLVKKIGLLDTSALNSFYQCADNITIHQNNIKNFSYQALINNTYNYQGQYAYVYIAAKTNPLFPFEQREENIEDKINNNNNNNNDKNIKAIAKNLAENCLIEKPYIPIQFKISILKYLTEYDCISIDCAYAKLRKIANIK